MKEEAWLRSEGRKSLGSREYSRGGSWEGSRGGSRGRGRGNIIIYM